MEVDNDNYYYIDPDAYRPVVVRDQEEMKNIVYIANELFYDPARYSLEDLNFVGDMVNRIQKPIPDTLDDTYELFIYSTLLYFVSEEFDILPTSPCFTGPITYPNVYDYIRSQENKVPVDWRNAIVLRFLRIDGEFQCTNDRLAEYMVKTRDQFYTLRILLSRILREVCIYLAPYSDHGEVITHETDPQVIFNVEIARLFIMRDRWLHFGFYVRYNLTRIFYEEMRRALGHSGRFARQIFRSPSFSLCTTPLIVNFIEEETSTTDAPNPARSASPNKTAQFVNQIDERSWQGPSQQGPSQQGQSTEQNYDRGSGLDMLIAAAQVLDQGWVPIDTEATSSHLSHITYAQRPG